MRMADVPEKRTYSFAVSTFAGGIDQDIRQVGDGLRHTGQNRHRSTSLVKTASIVHDFSQNVNQQLVNITEI